MWEAQVIIHRSTDDFLGVRLGLGWVGKIKNLACPDGFSPSHYNGNQIVQKNWTKNASKICTILQNMWFLSQEGESPGH